MVTVPQEIKDLLHNDHCAKNIRIHFPNGERSDICNDLIVKDSVSFTETLCSQDNLKLGLCESPIFECEVVGVGFIKGATIDVYCEIYCDPTVDGAVWKADIEKYVYQIYYGTFVVESAQRQADMIHRKIKAYGGFAPSFQGSKNKIQFVRDYYGLKSATAYRPKIIDMGFMLMGFKKRIPNLTFSEPMTLHPWLQEWINYTPSWHPFPYEFNLAYYYGNRAIGVECKIMNLPWSGDLVFNLDTLIYCDYDESSKSLKQIADELAAGCHHTGDVNKGLELIGNKWLGCGLGGFFYKVSGDAPHLPQSYLEFISAITRFQDGHYIYPYQYIYNFDQGKFPDNNANWKYFPIVIVPYAIYWYWEPGGPSPYSPMEDRRDYFKVQFRDPDNITFHTVNTSAFPQNRLNIPRNITERRTDGTYYKYDAEHLDYLGYWEASEELRGCFGRLKRDYTYEETTLKQLFNLTPSQTLYPGSSVYPEGVVGGKMLPEDYQKCWYDDEYTKPWGAIKCTYSHIVEGTETHEEPEIEQIDYTHYLTGFNAETDVGSYQIYDVSENIIIKASIWTPTQITNICTAIANSIGGVKYIPVEFTGRGLPYVETGDTYEVLTRSNDSITTVVLNRVLKGEQTLTDIYKAM